MRVAVIGGGIQGTTVAMELSMRGIDVDLFDSHERLMNGASRHSEGKIHLGFTYAKDSSHRTAELQMRGAAASLAPKARSYARSNTRWMNTALIFPSPSARCTLKIT